MKHFLAILLLCVFARAGDASKEPEVVATPFEPPLTEFFKMTDKFAHPTAIVSPRFLFPFEFRKHGGAVTPAEVIILVQLDDFGRAKTLKVLSSRHQYFTASAIDALKKAKWEGAGESWFYYRHVYTLDE